VKAQFVAFCRMRADEKPIPVHDPLIHHRRSIRLRGYDYARAGMYFITICCQGRVCRFGTIENGKMILNDAGKMIEKWHLELPNKFNDIELGEYVVMPNHFHAIIINNGSGAVPVPVPVPVPVGADTQVGPYHGVQNCDDNSVGADLHVRPENANCENVRPENANRENVRPENNATENVRLNDPDPDHDNWGEHAGSPLSRVVQWFKTMTTNEYIRGVKNLGWERFDGKLWQRNYYEHIIRDEKSYSAISNYIINNPAKWIGDQFHGH
jgi:putative transposase